MTNRQLVFVAAAAISTLVLNACSVHAGGGDMPSLPDVQKEAFDNKVTGPDVEGSWTSACVSDFDQYVTKQVVFKGQVVDRTNSTFSDSACTKLKKTTENKGVFRWASKTTYGGYVIDYRFDIGNGITALPSEEVLVENGNLYLSDFAIGFGTIDKNVPLVKAGAATPSPTAPAPAPAPTSTDPGQVTGIPATTWKDVKYAVCNAQGFAYLLDFQNQDLSRASSGSVAFTGRDCNTREKFTPQGTLNFTLTQSGHYYMSFNDGSYIEQTGSGMNSNYAVLGGNSGPCVFLQNKGMAGIFADPGVWQCQ